MKNLFHTIILMFFVSQWGNAQISLTSATAPTARMAHKTREADSTSAKQLNVGAIGANQTWNFSTLVLDPNVPVSLTTYATTAGAPKASSFPTATIISRTGLDNSQGVNYQRINATEWVSLGDVDSAGTVNVAAEPTVNFKYPFTFNSNFKDTANFEDPDLGTITVFGTTTGDAWGSVRTSLGTFNALRVKRVYVANVSFQGFPISLNVTNNEWWTATHAAPVLLHSRIIVDFSAFGILDTVYNATILTAQTVGTQEVAENHIAKAYPNPAIENVTLDLDLPSTTKVSALIIGTNGQGFTSHSFGELAAGKQTQSLNVSNLPSGVYQVILMSDKGKIGLQKIIVTH